MPTPCLKEFIATVPSCTQQTPVGKALDLFEQSKCDRLVVVSEQQRPLGVLHLHSLLPYLRGGKGKQTRLTQETTAKKPETAKALTGVAVLQQPISELGLSIISPIATLPADFTLKQFWPYLQDQSYKTGTSHDCALVSKAGKFLGLLDTQRLLQFLVTNLPAIEADLKPQDFSGVTEKATSKNIALEVAALNPLIQLLERLPLPVMLQTSSGQSLRQNSAWRQQFDSLQDPEWLRGEMAQLLETAPTEKQEKSKGKIHSHWQDSDKSRFATAGSLPKVCHLGASPDICTCVCPMQNGSERVWQFIKIPLGNVLSSQDLSWGEKGTLGKLSADPLSESSFRLANLMAGTDSLVVAPPTLSDRHEGLKAQYETFRTQYEAFKTQYQTHTTSKTQDSELVSDLWLVLAQDVTESHLVANELAAKNADLIQLNRLKDEFLACITHELKTPLTAIMGLSSLLKDRILGELNDRQSRYARLIHQSGRHLMTIVNDILDLTRMETGQLELMLSPVEISDVCDRAYQQARQQHLSRKNKDPEDPNPTEPEIRFTLAIETDLDILIADEMRLRQMLVHLLSNALKFTETDGEIGLKVSFWEGWIAFTVWDTGIGIPEDKQHLIFQKFQQLENPLTRQFDGTGLGLVLTQRLARLHGGDVTFTSKSGVGSEFTLLLPPSPPSAGLGTEDWELVAANQQNRKSGENSQLALAKRDAIASFGNYQSRLVLIVEPTASLIEDLSKQLTSLGYRVVVARSGTEALEKARQLQPSAIFLNPLLPQLSGWDVLTLLKASPQTQHIPVIITASRGEKEYALAKRADGFLSLPVQQETLRQTLEKLTTRAPASKKQQTKSTGLTILRLSMGEKTANSYASFDADLCSQLHQRNYRVLEADDLVQAELLARIWRPHIVLLEGQIPDPQIYLQQLSEHQSLASLPLVTLDEATTQAAMQVGNRQGSQTLQVFPCLGSNGDLPEPSTLIQAIEVAAGISCQLSILVVDISKLPDLNEPKKSNETFYKGDRSQIRTGGKKRTEWLQALIQYLQTAGFKVVIGRSWEEVLRQAQHYSVDLLLMDLGNSTPKSVLMKALGDLRKVPQRPPTLILERLSGEIRTDFADDTLSDYLTISNSEFENNKSPQSEESFTASASPPIDFLAQVLGEVATQILPASLSMEELLDRIRQTLMRSNSSGANSQLSVNQFVTS